MQPCNSSTCADLHLEKSTFPSAGQNLYVLLYICIVLFIYVIQLYIYLCPYGNMVQYIYIHTCIWSPSFVPGVWLIIDFHTKAERGATIASSWTSIWSFFSIFYIQMGRKIAAGIIFGYSLSFSCSILSKCVSWGSGTAGACIEATCTLAALVVPFGRIFLAMIWSFRFGVFRCVFSPWRGMHTQKI